MKNRLRKNLSLAEVKCIAMARKNTKTVQKPIVGLVMGSQSDWDTMQNAARILTDFGVPFESGIVSAHRTPHRLVSYGATAVERGLKVVIAGAGGAAQNRVTAAAAPPGRVRSA